MNQQNIKIWIDALRSGEYKQTGGRLQDAQGYCCLGVACDIFIPKKLQILDPNGFLSGGAPINQYDAPNWLKELVADFFYKTEEHLTSLNDSNEYSFDEIADLLQLVYIEKMLEGETE